MGTVRPLSYTHCYSLSPLSFVPHCPTSSAMFASWALRFFALALRGSPASFAPRFPSRCPRAARHAFCFHHPTPAARFLHKNLVYLSCCCVQLDSVSVEWLRAIQRWRGPILPIKSPPFFSQSHFCLRRLRPLLPVECLEPILLAKDASTLCHRVSLCDCDRAANCAQAQ
jgi:hypothetical protein